MSTSAGFSFKADENTVQRFRRFISQIDDITNDGGYGYACTPSIYKDGEYYHFYAQTHWDYSGKERGKPFIEEVKKFLKKNNINIKMEDIHYY